MDDCSISIRNLCKIYKMYDKNVDRFKEVINPFKHKYHREFTAVNDVSFDVKKNECLGIIGKNGSGKSTLLKMVTGVLTPTFGNIEVEGKISALLELGAGFNPEFTGIENVYLNGTLMGYSKRDMDAKLNDILDFADIGDFVFQPVKTYSSGMFVRLAFAVAINVEPDILIVDEALSVGDIRFQQKCYRKIEALKSKATIIFVTHDMTVINKYCDRVIWINEGKLIEEGTPLEVSKKYQAYMIGADISTLTFTNQKAADENEKIIVEDFSEQLDVMGDDKALITGMTLYDDASGLKTTVIEPLQEIKLRIKVNVFSLIKNAIVGFTIKDRLGNIITQTNSFVLGQGIEDLEGGKTYIFGFNFKFPHLNHGQYTISPAVASGTQEEHIQHSWVHDALVCQVIPVNGYSLSGIVHLDGVKFENVL
ncbi:ABC transporter ATP-binding protein [Paenibacillus taiwanensis]|uniref:ABC transporter ATP-binding protein n=1 Tax=Paenibacillus taiwanensis TaxID=401638 RepID=UPI0004234C72|nr:ABC transporter ATP-binding protein [Paenibacillus taiwanensis]